MRYYDLQKSWTKRIEPHLGNKQLNNILVRDLNKLSSSDGGNLLSMANIPGSMGTCIGHMGTRVRHRGIGDIPKPVHVTGW
jgi:hypothetical protein